MKIRYIDAADICWQAEVTLNSKEWPSLNIYADDWLDRPIRKWVYDNIESGDHFFSVMGQVYFRSSADAEWFRMVWEQEI